MQGIFTMVVLSVGRVIRETAIFHVTLGGSYCMPTSIMSPGRTMALHVYYLAMETRAFDKAMGTATILVLSMILVNAVINYFSHRLTARLGG